MSFPLVVWTVACLGLGAAVAADVDDHRKLKALLPGIAAACIVWAVGIGVWEVVGVIL